MLAHILLIFFVTLHVFWSKSNSIFENCVCRHGQERWSREISHKVVLDYNFYGTKEEVSNFVIELLLSST